MHTTKNTQSKCVMARISRQGKSYQKNFGLLKYKTWKAAESAAQKWIKKTLPTLPPATPREGRMSSRNQSGVVGVWPRLSEHVRNGSEYQYCRWYARWPGCPLKGGISFSADVFGDEEAFVMACLALQNKTIDRDSVAKRFAKFWGTKKCEQLLEKKQLAFE